ncbi:MAG: alpha/beta hydrolase [Planctomycetota bacterium]
MNAAHSTERLPLRDDGDGDELGATLTHLPLPETRDALGTVLVLPGGGYRVHADHEAEPVAEFFRGHGFHAAVLRYRLAPHHQHPAMLHDAQRAVRMLRDDPRYGHGPVAVLGFSAGGHLAATLATHGETHSDPSDPLLGQHTARPDAAVLGYPVIHLAGEHAHGGSGHGLLGVEDYDAPLPMDHEPSLNVDQAVTPETCPTFCWHTADDAAVPAMNSVAFAQACWRHGVPCELHVFTDGRHGLGMAETHPPAADWPASASAFLKRTLARGAASPR